jgi:hypothetical protein
MVHIYFTYKKECNIQFHPPHIAGPLHRIQEDLIRGNLDRNHRDRTLRTKTGPSATQERGLTVRV